MPPRTKTRSGLPNWCHEPATEAGKKEVELAYVHYCHACNLGPDGQKVTAVSLPDLYRDLVYVNPRWVEVPVHNIVASVACFGQLHQHLTTWRRKLDRVAKLYREQFDSSDPGSPEESEYRPDEKTPTKKKPKPSHRGHLRGL